MTRGWMDFFASFPDYKNTFNRIESRDNFVILLGYAYWNEENTYDPAIWTAKIEDDHVAEWRIYEDTQDNRKKLGVV
jgi:hypothetical protein